MRQLLLVTLLTMGCANPILEAEATLDPEPVEEVDPPREVLELEVDTEEQGPSEVELLRELATAVQASRRPRTFVSRGRTWNVPDESGPEAEATGMLRVCASEIAFRGTRECEMLWQTITRGIRQRHCNRERVQEITECEDGEETNLSAMRRAQRHAMGVIPPIPGRRTWVRRVDLSCETPQGHDETWWTSGRLGRSTSLQEDCQSTAAVVRELVAGTRSGIVVRNASPMAFGGRCERVCTDPTDRSTCSNRGACDDPIACSRDLARIPGTEHFRSAYWCRRGRRGCPTEIDPVCIQFLPPEEGAQHATDELRSRDGQVQDPQEGVQRGELPVVGPVVLDLHGVPGDGQRQAGGTS